MFHKARHSIQKLQRVSYVFVKVDSGGDRYQITLKTNRIHG